MAQLINCVIKPDGSFSVDLSGFNGIGCADVQRAFDTIGKPVVTRNKPEFKAIKQGQGCK